MEMNRLRDRLEKLRDNKGLSQRKLAMASGMSPEQVSNIESGKTTNVGVENIEKLAKVLEVAPAELAFGASERPDKAFDAPDYEPLDIPVIGLAKAGKEGFFDDAGFPVGEGFRKVHRPDFVKDKNAYALEIDGDSMSPMIEKGWTVVASPKKQLVSGDLAIARLSSGEVMLKKVKFMGGLVVLTSINPSYEPIALKKKDLDFLHKIVMIQPK